MIEMRFLSAEELERLAQAMPTDRDRILALLLGWCGLRFGEAAALRVEDADPLRRRMRVRRSVTEVRGRIEVGEPKSHAARSVPMPAVVAQAVGGYRSGSDLLFPDERVGYLRVTNWHRRTFAPAAIDAGLAPAPLRVHDLRHSAASLMIRSGASVKAVKAALGHATATMTLDRYGHLFPDELDALADGLDGSWQAHGASFPVRGPVSSPAPCVGQL
jgi:integrase